MPGDLHAIIFFDGVCNLCNGAVNVIIKHDRKEYFKFASLQSEAAKKMLPGKDFLNHASPGIVLLENGKFYFKSTAALRIAKRLNGAYQLLYVFMPVPLFIRNFVYDFVARNRYRWFGKRDQCRIPSADEQRRFIG